MPLSVEVVNRSRSRLGTVLNGKWRLDQILGIGGMATVYSALHRNQKRVAVKMLHTELSVDSSIRSRFLREGYLANMVDHPGAVTIFDDDIADDGAAFLVMELLEGETVQAKLGREGVLSPASVLDLGDQLLDVLVAAHEKGIIHRDLKPENLFITRGGQLKVLDFGIARLRETPIGSAVTATGFFMGTPAFMAPEHARGKWDEVDAQSDIWSVGATLFCLLTGQFVHDSETPMDTVVLAVTKAAPPILTVSPTVPPAVAEVVDRALAFQKEERWESALTMQAALRSALFTLAPEEVIVRGSQRLASDDDRPPSDPEAASHVTVRSARPKAFSSAPTLAPTTPPKRRSVLPAEIEPRVDDEVAFTDTNDSPSGRSGSGLSFTSRGKSPGRRSWVGAVLLLSILAVLVAVVAANSRSNDSTQALNAGTGPSVLVQKTIVAEPAAPSEPASPAAETAAPAEPGHRAAATAHAAPTPRPPVRAAQEGPDAKSGAPASSASQAAAPQVSSPAASRSPARTDANPFDRRF